MFRLFQSFQYFYERSKSQVKQNIDFVYKTDFFFLILKICIKRRKT